MAHLFRAGTSLGIMSTVVLLSGCEIGLTGVLKRQPPEEAAPAITFCDPTQELCPDVFSPDEDTVRPAHRPGTPAARVDGQGEGASASGAVSGNGEGFVEGVDPDKLDKTSESEVARAVATGDTGGERSLGKTIASLGDVASQGFWLKTPLVIQPRAGRVVWADNGNSVNVTLEPRGGDGGGSQISLAAMRALGIPLTALPELLVFAK